jgi:hypothetical protein
MTTPETADLERLIRDHIAPYCSTSYAVPVIATESWSSR